MTENNAAQAMTEKLWRSCVTAASLAPTTGSVVVESSTILAIDNVLSALRAEDAQASDERAAFEAYVQKRFGGLAEPWDANAARYPYGPDQARWEAWRDGRAALASAPVAGKAYQGDNVAERLDNMADDQPPGSQAQSDLYAAATIWRKHIAHRAAPQASEAARILFPTHLRKMWSGGEVQDWLDEHHGITAPKPSAKGSLERYRKWQAEQTQADKDGAPTEAQCKEAAAIARSFGGRTMADVLDGGDCAKGAGEGDLHFIAGTIVLHLNGPLDPARVIAASRAIKDWIDRTQLAAVSPTPSAVKQSLTATQTGEKGESDA